jgi:hypothetical protein
MSNRPHFLTSMSGVISAFQRHIARHLTPYGRKYRPFQPGEVAEYIGRSVVIIVLFIILHTLTCAGTFTYTLWYTSTKKKFLSAQDMRPYTRYVHLRSTTCVVLEPLEAPHVPSKRTSSLRPGRSYQRPDASCPCHPYSSTCFFMWLRTACSLITSHRFRLCLAVGDRPSTRAGLALSTIRIKKKKKSPTSYFPVMARKGVYLEVLVFAVCRTV